MIVSNLVHPLTEEDLQARGMIDWLPKPSELEQLAAVVTRALNKELN